MKSENSTADEHVRTLQIVCDQCGGGGSIRVGEHFLCGRCALGSTRIGIESLAELIGGYAKVVGVYLDGEKEPAIAQAYEVGREAHSRGAGTLDLAVLHQVALGLALVARDVPDDAVRLVHRAAVPLAQVLAPLEEDLDGLREESSRLRAHSQALREAERRRLASEIHDDTIQVMSAVAIGLEAICQRIDDPDVVPIVSELRNSVWLCIQRLRRLVFDVRSDALDKEGLECALRQQLERPEHVDLDCRLAWRLDTEPDQTAGITTYRIVQEALRNVRKHADATHVDVEVDERDGGILVRVRDDGVGFEPSADGPKAGHLGLTSMRERAEGAGGWFRVGSAPSRGATVEFWIPGQEEAPADRGS